MSDSGRIDVPFDPEQHLGEFVWLWSIDPPDTGGWLLCWVHDDDGGPVMMTVFGHATVPGGWEDAPAAELEGHPCLPLLRPTAKPGAGLEVSVRLPAGGSLQHVWAEPGDDATRAREAVIAERRRAAMASGDLFEGVCNAET